MEGATFTTKPGFWMALAIGGALVGAASFAQQSMTRKDGEPYRLRSVVRDFILGAFLSATIYMILPDSVDSLTTFLMKTGGSPISASLSSSASSDVELHTGPARF
ncbi:hypothetical protein EB001_23325 [bacterium]|jgi:hypothetical protein|nr:hypothetical protein [bacterium]